MTARRLVLMLIHSMGDAMDGKTKLQKMIYFVSLVLDKNLGFNSHFFGPYSIEVENALDELIGAGFIETDCRSLGVASQGGFEKKIYKYRLTDSGRAFAQMQIAEYNSEYEVIKEFVGKLEGIDNPDYFSMSLAAKAIYVLQKEKQPVTDQQIHARFIKFGWNAKENDFSKATDILRKLGFVVGSQ